MKSIKYIFSSLILLLVISCGGGDSGGDVAPKPDPDPVVVNPEASILKYPEDKTTCETGVFLDNNKSKITIEWNKAKNATSYKLVITNQNDISDKQEITNTSLNNVVKQDITLKQNAAYSWYVISRRGTAPTAQSKTWEFYNAAEGVQNYAPFPADLTSPENEITVANLTPTLEWTGADTNNDIKKFDILVDTVNPPVNSLGKQPKSATSVGATGLVAGTKYYWQVITSDDFGNSSKSQVKEFTTP